MAQERLGWVNNCHTGPISGELPVAFQMQEIARVMQGVDVMLMLTSNHAFALDYMTMEFYECLVGNSLLDQCKAVVLRIADRKKDDPLFQVNTKPLTADAVLDKSGLNKASNLQHKLCENKIIIQ